MISCSSLEKNKDGKLCKISRKRAKSHVQSNLSLKKKRRNNSLCSDVQNCIIEVTPGNDEIEGNVIEIKKDPDNYLLEGTFTPKEHDLHITLVNQTVDERIPTSQTISISEYGCMGSTKRKEENKTISEHTRSEVYPPSKSEGQKPLQKEISSIKNSLKNWQRHDLRLNCGTLTEEERKHLIAEVNPEYLLWVKKLKIPERCQYPQHFMVDDFEEVKEVLTKYEHETFTRLLVSDVNGGFRIKKTHYSGETVHFREKGKREFLFHGIPFAICGRLTFRCHQGFFAKRADKELQRDKKFGPNRKRYRKFKSSKKKNCPFRITVIKVLVFPEYRVDISKDSRSKLYQVSRFIKRNKEKIKFLVKYVFTLPSIFDHRNHQLGDESVSREAVDKRVFDKVEEYVRSGITKAPDVKELLKSFIQHDLEVDPSQWERRKYNPSLKDIRAKIYRTLRDMKAKVEQPVDAHAGCEGKVIPKSNYVETSSPSFPSELKHEFSNRPAVEQQFTASIIYTEEHVKKESYANEPDLRSRFSVDLSEGNVHHEELITIASIIDVQNDDSGVLDECYHDDDKRKKMISQEISKLNLLSVILSSQDLAELGNDISNVVSKWKAVLRDVCDTTTSIGQKDRARNTAKRTKRGKQSPKFVGET